MGGMLECEDRCLADSACKFFSTWQDAVINTFQCKLTTHCDRLEKNLAMTWTYANNRYKQPRVIRFQILGMYDSGTNALMDTLALNFPMCSHKREKGYLSEYFLPAREYCLQHTEIYKHSTPQEIAKAMRGESTDPGFSFDTFKTLAADVPVLAMVRDPLAQINGWDKAPYGMKACKCFPRIKCSWTVGNKQWLGRSCIVNETIINAPESGYGGGKVFGNFSNIFDLWNAYSGGYMKLRNSSLFKVFEVIKFEDLVVNPEVAIPRLATALGVDPPATLTPATRSAKSHGKSKGREEAIEKIISRKWLLQYPPALLKLGCFELNPSLLKKFTYEHDACNITGRLPPEEWPVPESKRTGFDDDDQIVQRNMRKVLEKTRAMLRESLLKKGLVI